jgi:hypothetical protein
VLKQRAPTRTSTAMLDRFRLGVEIVTRRRRHTYGAAERRLRRCPPIAEAGEGREWSERRMQRVHLARRRRRHTHDAAERRCPAHRRGGG